jgi:CSLREA domain-containing protein
MGMKRFLRALALGSALASTVLLSAPVGGGSGFVVDSEADAVDAQPGDGVCATEAGECTLRAAIQEANASGQPTRIDVPAGLYVLSLEGRGEDMSATGDLDLTGWQIIIEGAGADETVIDGSGLDSVFHVGPETYAQVSDIAIQNGESRPGAGGGLTVKGGLFLSDCLVQDNFTAGDGGGALVSGIIALDNCEFRANMADRHGGAIATVPDRFGDRYVIAQNSRFIQNSARRSGGGIYLREGYLEATLTSFEANSASDDGGAIYADTSDASLSATDVVGNVAERNGGGIASKGSPWVVVDSSINDNRATRGGGIFAESYFFDLVESELRGNEASESGGGAYFADEPAAEEDAWFEGYLDGTTVAGNVGGLGGGVYLAGSLLYVYGGSISENMGHSGGGIYAERGEVLLDEAAVTSNGAAKFGGGLMSNDYVELWASTIDGNSAPRGGGISISGTGSLSVLFSTVSNNEGLATGGGLWSQGPFQVETSTFSGNTAINGGAIWSEGDGSLSAATVAGNSAMESSAIGLRDGAKVAAWNSLFAYNQGACEAPIESEGFNLSDDASCGLDTPLDIVTADPLIGALADNGGPTQTHLPLPGSPAIDAAPLDSCLPEDQRWQLRPMGLGCDIGAVEVIPPPQDLFEGWNEISPWLGPPLSGRAMGMLDFFVDGGGWVSIAHYDGGWLQSFAHAPLPEFNTLQEAVPGEAYWLFMEAEGTLDFELTKEDYEEEPPPTTTPPPPTGTPPPSTRTPRPPATATPPP